MRQLRNQFNAFILSRKEPQINRFVFLNCQNCVPERSEIEQEYYQQAVGFQGEFMYAENLEEARIMLIGRKGFMPVEGTGALPMMGTALVRDGEPILRSHCAFWLKKSVNPYVNEFGDILKAQFRD